jgi:hypothetical protein
VGSQNTPERRRRHPHPAEYEPRWASLRWERSISPRSSAMVSAAAISSGMRECRAIPPGAGPPPCRPPVAVPPAIHPIIGHAEQSA